MSHCEVLPNGVVLLVTEPLTEAERAAAVEWTDLLRAEAEKRRGERRATMTEEERDAEDARIRAMTERSHARVRRLRGDEPDCPPHDPDGRRCRRCGATLPVF